LYQILLKGSSFKAKFQVMVPAKQPLPPLADTTAQYSGTGTFETMNTKVKGT